MAILIKEFLKPKNCFNCPFNFADCWCNITHSEIDRDDFTTKIPCPIVEVPKEVFDFFQNS